MDAPFPPSALQARIIERIVGISYFNPPAAPHMTAVFLTLDCGFTLTAMEGPADPAAFDAELGKRYAIEKALREAEPAFVLADLVAHKGQAPVVLAEPPASPTPAQEQAFGRIFRRARAQAEPLEHPHYGVTMWAFYTGPLQARAGYPALAEILTVALQSLGQVLPPDVLRHWIADAIEEDLA